MWRKIIDDYKHFFIASSLYLSFFANIPFKELEVVFTVSSCAGNPVLK